VILPAACLVLCTAGKRKPIKTAIIAITTRSSISVKALDLEKDLVILPNYYLQIFTLSH
jgi:hypothetical protein